MTVRKGGAEHHLVARIGTCNQERFTQSGLRSPERIALLRDLRLVTWNVELRDLPKVSHQQLRELWALAFFFVLEIDVDVAAGRGLARDGVGPSLDGVGRV